MARDEVIRALNEIEFVLTGAAAGDLVFGRRGRVREFELHLRPTPAGSWLVRLRARHADGPWEWVAGEGSRAGDESTLELSVEQLGSTSFTVPLDRHIIAHADRDAFGG